MPPSVGFDNPPPSVSRRESYPPHSTSTTLDLIANCCCIFGKIVVTNNINIDPKMINVHIYCVKNVTKSNCGILSQFHNWDNECPIGSIQSGDFSRMGFEPMDHTGGVVPDYSQSKPPKIHSYTNPKVNIIKKIIIIQYPNNSI